MKTKLVSARLAFDENRPVRTFALQPLISPMRSDLHGILEEEEVGAEMKW